jgi:hypothetical protein
MKLTLCIGGDIIPVLFDGKKVTTTHFPDIPVEYTAPCGTRITQKMLVDICRKKMQTLD